MLYRIGFIIEQTLGHITFHRNLAEWVTRDPSMQPNWIPIPYWAEDRWSRIPFVNRNMSLLLSLRARERVLEKSKEQGFDGLFYHTQVTALCSLSLMRRLPTVVSTDGTPLNMDTLAAAYNQRPDTPGPISHVKWRWNQSLFRRAAALTTWNQWAKDSLIQDYRIEEGKITVIPPGVDLAAWQPGEPATNRVDRPARLLFVGGDFARKGGFILLEAFRNGLSDRCELDIVTHDQTICSEGPVRVHRGLSPNSPVLRQLFSEADLFVLPTLGDIHPIVLVEAMASGLAVVATDVGAIREVVEDGVTGLLVPPHDARALGQAVISLLADLPRRRAFGSAGRLRADRLFCAERNSRRLIDLVKRTVDVFCSGRNGKDGPLG
jgi:glycosyltransferase involved in cell wall biosynthesis